MPPVSSRRGTRRKMDNVSVIEPPSKCSKVTLLHSSLLLLEIPADTNTSLPVWEAVRSQQLNVDWTVNPYSISVHLTPVNSDQGKTTTTSKSENASSLAQTLAPSISILQPNVLFQSVPPQQSYPQNTSCILLTFSQNSTQLLPSLPVKPNNKALTPTPATSLVVSLPIIITQPQPTALPSTPTIKAAMPAIQTPTTTPTKMPAIQTPTTTPTKVSAPSKVPAPSPFHTKSSSDIQICDNFLLGLCQAGKDCKMHHTPYPFHWQLWCVLSHKWVDIPSHSQVLLERHYCNVSQECVCIKESNVRNHLNFDSLELEEELKYDKVRRLTNSDSVVSNPHFPSKWKIYWWDDFHWEEYSENLSTLLLKKMSKKEPECSFIMDSKEYKVDFTTMMQTNIKTGFNREVRCRPFYYSPDYLQPYLRTGVLTNPAARASDPALPNFSVDPLEEFSSWYPPAWCQSLEKDYSLVDVPASTVTYEKVQSFFHKSMSATAVDIVSIQQVQNLLHWDKYQRQKAHMQKQNSNSKDPLERHVFHGTVRNVLEGICRNNFDPRLAGLNGASLGYGTYFATTASYSNRYSGLNGGDNVRHMFLAKVLVGKTTLGRSDYRRPPLLNSKTKYRLYDTLVDNLKKPGTFVVFDSCQCYPYYLIKYKDLPQEIEI